MNAITTLSDVLTLEETAGLLRLPAEAVAREADRGRIPGRKIEGSWRFLHSALEDWLRVASGREALLGQAGALADDESLDELRRRIYAERGRPECESSQVRS